MVACVIWGVMLLGFGDFLGLRVNCFWIYLLAVYGVLCLVGFCSLVCGFDWFYCLAVGGC